MTATIGRGLAGAGFAVLLIMVFQIVLVKAARQGAAAGQSGRVVTLMDLIVTSEDDSYSLSRLQIYLWTVAVMVGFSAVFWATGAIPDIPTNLCLLMGVNATATVAATALHTINTAGPLAKTAGKRPSFISDIFFNGPDSIDLPRTQVFMWTIVSLVVFIVSLGLMFKTGNFTLNSAPTVASLPDIPLGLVLLMGISHGAYLGAKAAVAKPAAPAVTAGGATPPS